MSNEISIIVSDEQVEWIQNFHDSFTNERSAMGYSLGNQVGEALVELLDKLNIKVDGVTSNGGNLYSLTNEQVEWIQNFHGSFTKTVSAKDFYRGYLVGMALVDLLDNLNIKVEGVNHNV